LSPPGGADWTKGGATHENFYNPIRLDHILFRLFDQTLWPFYRLLSPQAHGQPSVGSQVASQEHVQILGPLCSLFRFREGLQGRRVGLPDGEVSAFWKDLGMPF
jgi:hypothetical protein